MEPITFELLDGYVDPATKKVHKSVVMHRMTMAEQIKIKSDVNVKRLANSQYSLSAPSQAGQLLALSDLYEFYLPIFKQTVDSIGDFTQEQIRGQAILESLTTRDIGWMIANQNGSQGPLISLKAIMRILEEVAAGTDIINLVKEKVESELGEPVAAD